jgi:SAM-dependent methyltransferase
MLPHSEEDDSTIAYYDQHAAEFALRTLGVDMRSLYGPFLAMIPAGGSILDAGCGAGRDTKAFLAMGYDVIAFDASEAMAGVASRVTGREVAVLRFQDLDYVEAFDGIWACASLLHVPRREMDGVFERLVTALKLGGAFYASFKSGKGERLVGGRVFTDFEEELFGALVRRHPALSLVDHWTTADLRPGRGHEPWLNILLRKVVRPLVPTVESSPAAIS